MVLQGRSNSSAGNTTLAAGGRSVGFMVPCFVQVFDSYSAYNISTVEVMVSEMDSASASSSILNQLQSVSNPDAMKQALAVASSVMNRVDCSLTPSCAAYNRESCLSTANTCGSCLSGYIGQSGDGNSMCVSESRRTTSIADPSGGTCESDVDCGGWEVCRRCRDGRGARGRRVGHRRRRGGQCSRRRSDARNVRQHRGSRGGGVRPAQQR